MGITMPQGRIVLKRICQSRKLAELKDDGARLLYTWLLPNVNANGCFSGDAAVVNGQIFTRLRKSHQTVRKYLQKLEAVGLIILYEADGDIFLQIPDFIDKQPYINPDREAKTTIPLPTPDQLKSKSRVAPPQSKSKREIESKVKVKEKHCDFVFLTPDEYKKLFSTYGEMNVGKLIADLNRYIGQSGKKYKSHYFALLNFAERDGVPKLVVPKEDAAAEQKALEKEKNRQRDEDGKRFQQLPIEKLKAMRKDKYFLPRWWLIDEIIAEKGK